MIRSLFLALAAFVPLAAFGASGTVTLYKSPNCGCCDEYADYLRDNGFEVEVIPTHDLTQITADNGVADALGGCHTALTDGYVFEGHIPVDSVDRMLENEPPIAGISVPGMPTGSPGMGGELSERLRVWTLPADSAAAPAIYDTYQRVPE